MYAQCLPLSCSLVAEDGDVDGAGDPLDEEIGEFGDEGLAPGAADVHGQGAGVLGRSVFRELNLEPVGDDHGVRLDFEPVAEQIEAARLQIGEEELEPGFQGLEFGLVVGSLPQGKADLPHNFAGPASTVLSGNQVGAILGAGVGLAPPVKEEENGF